MIKADHSHDDRVAHDRDHVHKEQEDVIEADVTHPGQTANEEVRGAHKRGVFLLEG